MIVSELPEALVVQALLNDHPITQSALRPITTHVVSGEATELRLNAINKDVCGAHSADYSVSYMREVRHVQQNFTFQKGSVQLHGINGLTNEVLLAMVMDRLARFQEGSLAGEDSGRALYYLDKAMSALQVRTCSRVLRGVEGKPVL